MTSDELKAAKAQLNLNDYEMAAILGIDLAYLRQMELGTKTISKFAEKMLFVFEMLNTSQRKLAIDTWMNERK